VFELELVEESLGDSSDEEVPLDIKIDEEFLHTRLLGKALITTFKQRLAPAPQSLLLWGGQIFTRFLFGSSNFQWQGGDSSGLQ
jgi:hypothetical protein